jgi:hypothetical protein
VAGWGHSSTHQGGTGSIYDVEASSAILQMAQITPIPFDECKEKLTAYNITSENHICAGGINGKHKFNFTLSCFSFCCVHLNLI